MTHFSQPDKPVPTDVPRCQGGGEDWLNTLSNNNNTYCNNNIVKLICRQACWTVWDVSTSSTTSILIQNITNWKYDKEVSHTVKIPNESNT